MNNKRELWPDKVKFIAVIMVILSHLPYNIPFVNGLYAPVFMPLFFYVSGYFYKKSLNSLLRRTRVLLIPFLLIGTLLAYFYSSSVLNVYPESNFKDNFCMFGCYIIAMIINRYIPEILGKKRGVKN